jgi:hypothetical protein
MALLVTRHRGTQEHHSVAEAVGLGEVERGRRVGLREQGFASADEYRVDVETNLVDEAVLEEGGGEVGATEAQVAMARLVLEGLDLPGDDLPDVVFQSACSSARE